MTRGSVGFIRFAAFALDMKREKKRRDYIPRPFRQRCTPLEEVGAIVQQHLFLNDHILNVLFSFVSFHSGLYPGFV